MPKLQGGLFEVPLKREVKSTLYYHLENIFEIMAKIEIVLIYMVIKPDGSFNDL